MSVRLGSVVTLITDAEDLGALPLVALESVESGTGALVTQHLPEVSLPNQGVATARVGDVLFGKLRPYLAKTWRVDRPVYASTELMCLRPDPGIDGHWLGYVAASRPVVEWAVATSDGAKMPRTSWERLRQLRLDVPPLQAQRAIADYLDRETARIDALTSAKRRMIELVEERRRSSLERILWGEEDRLWPGVPLRRVASRIDVGIAEAATHAYATSGVPLLRSMNIRENVIDDQELLFIQAWFADRNRSKYVLAGDILTVRTGNVGVSALVPQRLDHCQCFTQLITTVAPPKRLSEIS